MLHEIWKMDCHTHTNGTPDLQLSPSLSDLLRPLGGCLVLQQSVLRQVLRRAFFAQVKSTIGK